MSKKQAKKSKGKPKASSTARPSKIVPRPEAAKPAEKPKPAAPAPAAPAAPHATAPLKVSAGDVWFNPKNGNAYKIEAVLKDDMVVIINTKDKPGREVALHSTITKMAAQGYAPQSATPAAQQPTPPAKPAEPEPRKAVQPASGAPEPAKLPQPNATTPIFEIRARLLVSLPNIEVGSGTMTFLSGTEGTLFLVDGKAYFSPKGNFDQGIFVPVEPHEFEVTETIASAFEVKVAGQGMKVSMHKPKPEARPTAH